MPEPNEKTVPDTRGQMAIFREGPDVVLKFPEPVMGIGLSANEAITVGSILIRYGRSINKGNN